jgi:cellulose synthase/poly-beta-1,6-N-acetylglucosamine synthase-like glycosyltransferase
MSTSFQIVVPIYNEEDVLQTILERAAGAGYLEKIIFVDDASTDGSRAVLRNWVSSHNIRAVFLDKNKKKEGAIREVLERLEARRTLEPYTILLDADSFFTRPADGTTVITALQTAISTMHARGLAGMAFRIDAAIDRSANFLELCAFADYSSMQFDHWVTSHQQQVWVINGPGGLFRSDLLLETLRGMQPDFDTGDLLITVRLMSKGHGVAYYPDVQVQTFVPRTLKAYFTQRRRWERGTTKVLWWERAFYARLFTSPKLLAIETLIHLSLYVGILMAAIGMASPSSDALRWIVVSYFVWLSINLLKGFCNVRMRNEGHWRKYILFCAANGILWIAVTIWARCAGFIDALRSFFQTRNEYLSLAKQRRQTQE